MILYVSVINIQYTHTHLFILMTVMKENIDSTASRQVWSRRRRSWIQWSWSSCWSRFRKLSSNCEDFPKVSVDGKLNYDAMIVYIYIYICVIHLKICLHILINDDDLTVNWVWVCCKNIATYPGCCSMFNSKGFARCKHLAEKDWYLVPWNRQQYGVSTRVPLMIHNCDVLVLYETFMKIGDTVPFLLQKPR